MLAGPVIGGIIGYCTNYIAVKMLFRPFNPVKIGKFTLPFTPGIIPKRKPALAHAIGQAVGTALLNEEELHKLFMSESMKGAVINGIVDSLNESVFEVQLKELTTNLLGEDEFEEKKNNVVDAITTRITEGFLSIDVGSIIATEGGAALKQKGGMLAMFINDDLIASLAKPIGDRVDQYVQENGADKIRNLVEDQVDDLLSKDMKTLVGTNMNSDIINNLFGNMYDAMFSKHSAQIVQAFNVTTVVEDKINAMDVRELEHLIMSVMKNELGMIVNLGAVIGFLLGLFNLFF